MVPGTHCYKDICYISEFLCGHYCGVVATDLPEANMVTAPEVKVILKEGFFDLNGKLSLEYGGEKDDLENIE